MRRQQKKKAHLNLSINPDVLELFDLLEPAHKREYSEFVEEKLLELIEQYAPDMVLELKIKAKREELSELEENYHDIKSVYSNLRKFKEGESKRQKTKIAGSRDLEKIRLEKLNPIKSNVAFQVKKGNADWKRISEVLLFDSTNEAKDWVINTLQEECLID